MPRRTSPATILARFFLVAFVLALFPYGIFFMLAGAISLPFLAFIALAVTLFFNGFQWLGHRAFGATFYGDDPAYRKFLEGGDPYFHLTCPPPFNNDSDEVRWSGGDEPELQWVCNNCGTQVCGHDAPCPTCGYEQYECPQCGSPVKDAWAACGNCGNDPLRQ